MPTELFVSRLKTWLFCLMQSWVFFCCLLLTHTKSWQHINPTLHLHWLPIKCTDINIRFSPHLQVPSWSCPPAPLWADLHLCTSSRSYWLLRHEAAVRFHLHAADPGVQSCMYQESNYKTKNIIQNPLFRPLPTLTSTGWFNLIFSL